MSQVYDEPIVVRLTQPVGPYPVGTEFGFRDVADAIRALGSASYFKVVRTQDGDPIPPPTPEDLDEAQKAALARARAARLIRGADFDPLVPGPGEVIVGGPDGPVARDVSEIVGGARAPGNTVVYFGDSLMGGGPDTINSLVRLGTWITLSAGGRLRVIQNSGIPGNTTAQMLARIEPDVLALNPSVCIVMGGTNDVAQSVPLATYIDNMTEIMDRLQAAGIRPVVLTIPPRALSRSLISQYNAWLTAWCAGRGIPIIDTFTPAFDPATGGIISTFDSDGTHFNQSGYRMLGQKVWDAIESLFPNAALAPATANDDASNLIANGLFIGDENSDGVADSWSRSGTMTTSLVAGESDVAGNWQVMDATGTTTRYINQVINTEGNAAPGDWMHFTGLADIGASADDARWSVQVICRTAANSNILPIQNAFYRMPFEHPEGPGAFTFSHHFRVPENCANFRIMLQVETGASVAKFAQLTLRNLTAMGLA